MSSENTNRFNWPFFILISAVFHFVMLTVISLGRSGPKPSDIASHEESRPQENKTQVDSASKQESPSELNKTSNSNGAASESTSSTPVKSEIINSPAEQQPVKSNSQSIATTVEPRPAAPQTIDYVVSAGDSLTRIAKRHKCTVTELAKLNNLKPTSGLFIGQRLKLPAPVR